jgi:hypothetical protein
MTHFAALVLLVLAAVAHADDVPILTIPTTNLSLRDDPVPPLDPSKRYIKLRGGTKREEPPDKIALPPMGSTGDPTAAGASGGGGSVTVYNPSSGESFTVDLPAERWVYIGGNPVLKGYRFANALGPIFKVFVKPDKLYVRGGTAAWGYTLEEESQGRIALRVTLGTGITWCVDVPPKAPAAVYDRPGKFFASRAERPEVCPPLP